MDTLVKSLLDAVQAGQRLLAVHGLEFLPILQSVVRQDPQAGERGLLTWDSEDGFQPVRDIMDPPPACLELIEALEFIENYRGAALFLLDGTDGVFSAEAEAARPRLKRLASKAAASDELAIILVVSSPLPAALLKSVHWIGPPGPEEPGTESIPLTSARGGSGRSARRTTPETSATSGGKSRPVSNRWKEIQSLEAFDTVEWQLQLENLSVDDVQEIVKGGRYRDALERIRELQSQIKRRFASKDSIVHALANCAVAQVPCILMGPPGTAKGHLVRTFCEGLGLTQGSGDGSSGEASARRYFEYQLTRFTTPEELFGPVHVQDLIDRQIYRRVTSGYLPTAHVAFLDELFKASSAILNTLLSILNERVFYNEGRPQRVPLTTIFAASNEPPQEESLGALYDRFPIRVNCPSVEEDGLGLLQERAWADRFDRRFATDRQGQPQVACANDLRLLNRVSFVMFGGQKLALAGDLSGSGFDTEFVRVFRMMRREASISDRSITLLYACCRANALLDNRTELNADDLDVFRHVVWGKEQEFAGFFRQLKKNYRV